MPSALFVLGLLLGTTPPKEDLRYAEVCVDIDPPSSKLSIGCLTGSVDSLTVEDKTEAFLEDVAPNEHQYCHGPRPDFSIHGLAHHLLSISTCLVRLTVEAVS